jgi:NhaP-type Na+/H+ or K+/H+ antiporter
VVDLVVLASVVFFFGLVSRRLERTVLTAPLVFVAAGIILGPAGLGLVEFKLDDHTVLLLGEITLAIVLFTDAARTNLSTLRRNEGLPLRLLGVGMPLTISRWEPLSQRWYSQTFLSGRPPSWAPSSSPLTRRWARPS